MLDACSRFIGVGSWMLNVRLSSPSIFRLPSSILLLLLPLLLFALPDAVHAQDFTYTTNDGTITITGYTGSGGAVTIPSTINGLPVTSIGDMAFYQRTNLTNVTIPDSVTSISNYAFSSCTSLTGVYFQGNAPSVGTDVFFFDNKATVYYLPGTTGWGATFGGRPAALWKPQVLTSDASFGVRTNQFGFNITWASGWVVVVEACTDLANPIWSPVGTNTLPGGSSYFSDPEWTKLSRPFLPPSLAVRRGRGRKRQVNHIANSRSPALPSSCSLPPSGFISFPTMFADTLD